MPLHRLRHHHHTLHRLAVQDIYHHHRVQNHIDPYYHYYRLLYRNVPDTQRSPFAVLMNRLRRQHHVHRLRRQHQK